MDRKVKVNTMITAVNPHSEGPGNIATTKLNEIRPFTNEKRGLMVSNSVV